MKKTATLIMLDKPILVNEERIKVGDILYVDDIFHSVEDEKDFDSTLEYPKVIAGHEGTKRLTFNLSEEDAKRIGYVDVKKLADETYSEFPTDKQSIYNKDINAPRKRKAFIKGAETYASLTPKKYTEEDLMEFAKGMLYFAHPSCITKEELEIFLKQRQPKQFSVEYTETENEITTTKLQRESP